MNLQPLDSEELAEQRAGTLQVIFGRAQERFRKFSKHSGAAQKDIAARLPHRDATYVSRCLSGQKNMTVGSLHDLARAMNSRLEVTFVGYEEMTPRNNRAPRGANPFDAPANGARDTNEYWLKSEGARTL